MGGWGIDREGGASGVAAAGVAEACSGGLSSRQSDAVSRVVNAATAAFGATVTYITAWSE